MTDRCVIRADFADFRRIKGRKVLQLIMEISLEEAEVALNTLGHPKVGESTWVAIALLKPAAEAQAPEAGGSSKSPKPFSTLPLSQQAVLRCKDKSFQDFMCHTYWNTCVNESDEAYTTRLVKDAIGFESRSALDDTNNAQAIATWRDIDARYKAHLTDQQYADVRR